MDLIKQQQLTVTAANYILHANDINYCNPPLPMHMQVQQGSTLVIEKMDSTKTGTYTCAATNSNLGNSAVALATLTLYSESRSKSKCVLSIC